MDVNCFIPVDGNTVVQDATDATGRAAIQMTAGGSHVWFHNEGSDLVYIVMGGASVSAGLPADGSPAKGLPIPSGMVAVLDKGVHAYFAARCKSRETATVYATSGDVA